MTTAASFRVRQIYVTAAHYDALRALAEVLGADCPDAVAETILGEVLSAKAELAWLVQRRRDDNEKRREDYMARVRIASGPAEELP